MTSINDIDKSELFVELTDGGKWYFGRSDNEITIEQIAHSLSGLARFTGHAKRLNGGMTYTVAEHSVKVSYIVPTLTALLHDSAEVITNDLSSPIKAFMGNEYRKLSDSVEAQFGKLFTLDFPPMPITVKYADTMMVLIEAFDLLESKGRDWPWFEEERLEALKLYVAQPELRAECWSPDYAYERFMARYMDLTNPVGYLV